MAQNEPDAAARETDRRLAEMEKRLEKIYKDAQKEIQAKWDAYMEKSKKKIEDLQKQYDELKKKPNATSKGLKELKERLDNAKRNQTIFNDKYKEMVEQTAERITNVNRDAQKYINGEMPYIYTVNYNAGEKVVKKFNPEISWSLIDEHTVAALAQEKKILREVDIDKDKAWNRKAINAQVMQGILQGESIPVIAQRLQNVTDMDKTAAIRNARTMCTAAQNLGRNDSYKHMNEDLGLITMKEWLPTVGDGRTREWHLSMAGQKVKYNEQFEDGKGNKLEYPGDPGAEPETIYNCRCTMIADIVGYKKE